MTNTTKDSADDANTRTREQTDEHTGARTAAHNDDASHVTVPADSNIIGGGTPDETDIGTASGTSNSGGG